MAQTKFRYFVKLNGHGMPVAGSPVLARKSMPKSGLYLELTGYCCAPTTTTTTTTTSSTTTTSTTVTP